MNNSTGPNFLDRRTLTAIALVLVTLIGWPYYLKQKYPQAYDKAAVPQAAKPVDTVKTIESEKLAPPAQGAMLIPSAQPSTDETTFDFKASELSFQISSKGMGIKNLKLLQYTNRKGETVEFSQSKPPLSFETRLKGTAEPLDFSIEKIADNVWVGHAKSGGLSIKKTLEINPAKYSLDVKIETEGQDGKFLGLVNSLSDEIEPTKGGSFLNRSQFDRQEAFVDTVESHNNHLYFTTDVVDKSWTDGRVVSLGSPYFTQIIADRSSISPEVKMLIQPDAHLGVVQLIYASPPSAGNLNIHYIGFAGPKSFDLLKSVDEDLVQVIDFGFFSTIAKIILRLLK